MAPWQINTKGEHQWSVFIWDFLPCPFITASAATSGSSHGSSPQEDLLPLESGAVSRTNSVCALQTALGICAAINKPAILLTHNATAAADTSDRIQGQNRASCNPQYHGNMHSLKLLTTFSESLLMHACLHVEALPWPFKIRKQTACPSIRLIFFSLLYCTRIDSVLQNSFDCNKSHVFPS